mmetsp:Transcript_20307/g.45164  ORF Transcript_20307/g.45164 Transcript_20307/m.45164 type:complete len:227 (+) Transcript_20307:1613-2293(+)
MVSVEPVLDQHMQLGQLEILHGLVVDVDGQLERVGHEGHEGLLAHTGDSRLVQYGARIYPPPGRGSSVRRDGSDSCERASQCGGGGCGGRGGGLRCLHVLVLCILLPGLFGLALSCDGLPPAALLTPLCVGLLLGCSHGALHGISGYQLLGVVQWVVIAHVLLCGIQPQAVCAAEQGLHTTVRVMAQAVYTEELGGVAGAAHAAHLPVTGHVNWEGGHDVDCQPSA